MIKYGFNIWFNEQGEIEMSDDAVQELMTFMAGMGVPADVDFGKLSPEFLRERAVNFYKGHLQLKRVDKKKFEEWIINFCPPDIEEVDNLSVEDWMDCIVNIYLGMCGVEFPEETVDKLEEKMN